LKGWAILENTRQKILQNSLSTFGTGGHELLVSNRQHFTVFKGLTFVFNAFTRFSGVVAAVETIVLAVKTSQWTAETTPAAVEEVPATVAGTPAVVKTTHATVTTNVAAVHTIHAEIVTTQWTAKITGAMAAIISSAIAEVIAAFTTSQRIVQIISCAAKIIPSEDLQFDLGSATVPVAVVGVSPATFISEAYLAGRQILRARRARSPIQN
jgi:hypothetical protein